MTTDNFPRILEAQRLDGGVIITFEDGKCAVYPAALLYETFKQANEVVTDED